MSRKAADVGVVQLNQTLQEEYQNENVFFWAPLLGLATYRPLTDQWELPETPIVKFNDFAKQMHGNELRIEMLRKIKGAGKTGKQPLVTKEKTQEFLAATIWIHGKREGIEFPDWIDGINTDWMDLANKAYPQLKMWLAKVLSTDPTACLLEGYSRHITEATQASGGWGLGKTKTLPKNFWVWDGGNSDFTTNVIAHSYTYTTYRDAIITKLLAAADADSFGVKTIYAATGMCNRYNIKPYLIDGAAFHVMVINSYQERDLLIEGTFPTLVAQADVRGMNNMLFKGAKYKWNGWIIYVNDTVARLPYLVSGTTLDFFNYSGGAEMVASGTNEDQPFEQQVLHAADQDVACALVIGINCVGFAEAARPVFTKETRDHEADNAVGIRIIYGMAAMNYYDHETPSSATDMADPQYAVIATHVK